MMIKLNFIKKILLIVFSSFVLIIFASFIYFDGNKFEIKEFFKKNLSPNKFAFFQVLLANKRSTNKLNNDYNSKFLPSTELLNLEFDKIDLSNLLSDQITEVGYAKGYKKNVKASFYLEYYKKNLLFLSKDGRLFYNNYKDLISNVELKNIENNLDLNSALDIFINENVIFVSGIKKINECSYIQIFKGEINDLKKIDFTNIFKSKECMQLIQAGRMQKLFNSNSILVSTAADILKNKDGIDPKPQNDNSIFGKTLAINLNDSTFNIFSKGHRNIIGLYSDNEIILATENGPKGGDEINKIIYGKNYGWPVASYGQKYNFKGSNKSLDYKDSHLDIGFVEPIYSFLPSIGISEIIKISNKFSEKWKNNFLVASLNGHHIYRIRFDKNYSKIIYKEKIFIGERIRDMIYLDDYKVILMTLENSGSLGILKEQVFK